MNYNLVLSMMGDFADSLGISLPGVGHVLYQNDAMPVFDPRFAAYCDNYFADVFPSDFPGLNPKSDPYLVGYMTDDELPWQTSTLDNYLTLPADDANRAAAESWLAARGSAVVGDRDRADFQTYVADTYYRITSQAIRRYDPNHMVMGSRLLGGDGVKPYLFQAAKPYVDVASVNYYDDLAPSASVGQAAAAADLPFVITETCAKGVDSGLPNRTGYGLTVRTRADRGAYYQSLALSVIGSPYGVGLHWLSLQDNNASNTSADASNTDANKGPMTVFYPDPAANPYKPLTDRIRDVNANLYPLIRGAAAPVVPAPDLTAASDTGLSDADDLTRDNTPTFAGTAPAGSAVALLVDDVAVASAVADASTGAYLLTAPTLADGARAVRVRTTTAASGLVSVSAALTVTVDTVAPQAVVRPAARAPAAATLDGFVVDFLAGGAAGAAEQVFGVGPEVFALTRDGDAPPAPT